MKGIQCFGRQGRITPKYIGPFRIMERVGAVLYRPASMPSIHDVFHVSMLIKHLRDELKQRVLDTLEVEILDDMTIITIPVCILAKEDKRLRIKVISLVKVQWNQKGAEEVSWGTMRICIVTTCNYLLAPLSK
ncbi:uncharacterized protein LOC109821642 [Asparagus officinalis]|uniref:uncharacterized protein LOC109821642 n=1 Tax=Asparagus officinalis TaxID=4686 RepID=UPI00098E3409|nr:uncharacterized protein LOC109821642 [Asparagus officinalis]